MGAAKQEFDCIQCLYLNREQFFKIDSVKSAQQNIECGVPQGSILALTLFILYINDLMGHTIFLNLVFCVRH